ncbi:MAG: PQQ-binding-like beta-propeller repeat protein, partial [Candidatus Promineifilaceae bacterium]|nr:PQQ-binding-like beta-propeller repeat protein [Candidatus Promineifilaceae bacterium]
AVDPDNHDAVTAVDLVDDGSGGKEAVIAWSSKLGPNSGASVAISPDGQSVYTVDGNNTIWGFDVATGTPLFNTGGLGQAAASPTVGPDGFIYAAGTEVLASLNPQDGTIRWKQSFDFLAQQLLPTLEGTQSELLVPDGTPRAYAINVVSRSQNKVWTTLVLGYLYNGFIPLLEALGGMAQPAIIPHKNLLIAADPSTGELIDGAVTEYSGGNEGLIELNPDGSIYISKADILVSPFYWTFNSTLPERFRTPEIPMGGITAFEPASFRDFSLEGIASVQNQVDQALSELPGGDVEGAFTNVRHGRLQLRFTAASVTEAAARGEISAQQADEAHTLLLQAAAGPMTEAYDLLAADNPSVSDQEMAKATLLQARDLLDSAATALQ